LALRGPSQASVVYSHTELSLGPLVVYAKVIPGLGPALGDTEAKRSGNGELPHACVTIRTCASRVPCPRYYFGWFPCCSLIRSATLDG